MELVGTAAALECSVLDLMDRWGIQGRERDEMITKVRVISRVNAEHDREKMAKMQKNREG